ncbi:MAG: prepilin-type N-terminal cleavage/methylation domain-containing protein [Planctomycetes bacterium]|nr:prepilin-type N-terminal cleavage/methylation domain-containing protein [Planctomycetota bacterium]MCH8261309.1 prepilin-type N-terminal cleavage/methylation domain-containing protein [Planctomycetota bacterium]
MNQYVTASDRSRRLRRGHRRGFNLIELLIALAITAALLSATMMALRASFMAYQSTTEVASTHTISRLVMHRMLALLRTGQDFGPLPLTPLDSIVDSNYIEFFTSDGQLITLDWVDADDTLYVVLTDENGLETPYPLLEGVTSCNFTLEYELGYKLHRATIDMTIVPDDNMSVDLDGDNQLVIRLVASAMPRMIAYE